MGISTFTDKQHQPTMAEVFADLGSKRPLWDSLTQFIADNYRVRGEFKFYVSKKYGWVVWYRQSGKTLVALYPGQGYFTAQIILASAQVEQAFQLKLGRASRKVLEGAHPYPEGRWLFLRVDSERDLEDVKRLLLLKAPLAKRPARPG
jgi:hypothetical protein